MIIITKAVRDKAKALQKQINKGAIALLDRHIDEYCSKVLSRQCAKRITEKNILITT